MAPRSLQAHKVWRFAGSQRRRHQSTAASQRAGCSVLHAGHVPREGALAREDELQGVLASEDHDYKPRLLGEFHELELGAQASELQQLHGGVQLQVQGVESLRPLQQ